MGFAHKKVEIGVPSSIYHTKGRKKKPLMPLFRGFPSEKHR